MGNQPPNQSQDFNGQRERTETTQTLTKYEISRKGDTEEERTWDGSNPLGEGQGQLTDIYIQQ